MKIIPFEDLKITTMTLVMSLTNEVIKKNAYLLLPVTYIENYKTTKKLGKHKLPHSDPGNIISNRYLGKVRGIIAKKFPFKNHVTIVISTTKKNIHLKLSESSIQMCGASSNKDGVEAAQHIINHLTNIQNDLDYINQHRVEFEIALEWVISNIKGEPVDKPSWERREKEMLLFKPVNDLIFNIYKPVPDHTVKIINQIPLHLDVICATFLISFSNDLIVNAKYNDYQIFYSDVVKGLHYISTIQYVIENPIQIDHIDEAMVNYNYKLGFFIDRINLDKYIDGENGFISRYNNALTTCVTIELPYEPLKNIVIKRKKNKIPHHTFLVYKSGSVTQSGPGGELMEQAYYLFMTTLNKLEHLIKYDPENTKDLHADYDEDCETK